MFASLISAIDRASSPQYQRSASPFHGVKPERPCALVFLPFCSWRAETGQGEPDGTETLAGRCVMRSWRRNCCTILLLSPTDPAAEHGGGRGWRWAEMLEMSLLTGG